jgi:di/tricarboxylate transporter
MLPLSTALEKTGAMASAVSHLSQLLAGADPRVVVGGLFAITSVVGLAISNTATAVLIAPIAIGLASHTGIDARCLVATVALSASCSFATPIATPMNSLVLEPGKYRFTDYLRLGLPLQLTLGVVIILLVPIVFPPFGG